MKIKHSIALLLSVIIFSCSDDIKILEDKIQLQAEKNNTEISKVDIKKAALYLNAWSKEDFYQEAIDEFLSQDLVNPPLKGSILFTGSSSIRFWKTLKEDMEPMQVINRGFGGAHIAHVNHHFDDVVTDYQPKAIVLFCGTNDIAALKGPKQTIDDFKSFLSKVRANLPGIPVFVIGIKPSVAREYLKAEEMEYNSTISEMSEKDELLFFVDVWEEMLTAEGKPNPSLFVEDGLHINAEGYKIWTRLVRANLINYFNL
jgi:lysophospholipase L1-like esterase